MRNISRERALQDQITTLRTENWLLRQIAYEHIGEAETARALGEEITVRKCAMAVPPAEMDAAMDRLCAELER